MKSTHIGSLPFKSIDQAVDFNLELDLPCLPTIPNFDEKEWMLNQFTSGFMQKGHIIPFSCFEKFFDKFTGRVKVQLCGIQTLYNNSPLEMNKLNFIDWYIQTVKSFIDRIPNKFILFFDEPDLRDLDQEVWNTYKKFTGYDLGIHCCGDINWRKLDLDSFKHISFDLYLISSSDIRSLRERQKTLYFGLDTKTSDKLDEFAVFEDEFLTPSCGLALKSEKEANLRLKELLA